MKSNCKYILDSLSSECGVRRNVIHEITIINSGDILSYTEDASPDYNVVSSIMMASGKKGFKVRDPRRVSFTGSNKAGTTGPVKGMNTKTLQFLLLGNNPEIARSIDALQNGSFTVALKTSDMGMGVVELFGLHSPCTAEVTPYTKAYGSDDENNGGYIITLTCTEVDCGTFLWLGSVEDTLEYYEELGWSERHWYGVRQQPSLSPSAWIREGNMNSHRDLPVHSLMKGCLLLDNGSVNYYLDPSDWNKKVNGSSSKLDGTDGQVMVEIPDMYMLNTKGPFGEEICRVSLLPVPGFKFYKRHYISAFEASIDRTNVSQPKLASVINTSAAFRGGNNTAAWDGTYRTLLGRPGTNTSLTNFRAYARRRGNAGMNGAGWNAYLNEAHQALYWLYTIEYANTNCQLPFNATPTANGYKQGGLGNGVTDMSDWNGFNGTNPFIPCGTTNSLGNKTGVVTYNVLNSEGGIHYAAPVPRYRGVENPFGHIWKWTDGIKCRIQSNEAGGLSEVYTCNNPANFQDVNYDNYVNMGDMPRTDGYIKKIIGGEHGIIMPAEVGGSSNTYFCDYFYTNIPATSEAQRGVMLGGAVSYGADAGLSYASTYSTASSAAASFGSRLCFLP
mgnify:CR=1 FL=1